VGQPLGMPTVMASAQMSVAVSAWGLGLAWVRALAQASVVETTWIIIVLGVFGTASSGTHIPTT